VAPIDKDVWKCFITEPGELCAMISLTTQQQELFAICLASGMNNRLLCSSIVIGISMFQEGGHRVANLLPVSGLVTALLLEGQNLLHTEFR